MTKCKHASPRRFEVLEWCRDCGAIRPDGKRWQPCGVKRLAPQPKQCSLDESLAELESQMAAATACFDAAVRAFGAAEQLDLPPLAASASAPTHTLRLVRDH